MGSTRRAVAVGVLECHEDGGRLSADLPKQHFLLVLARESGAVPPLPENVEATPLSRFAPSEVDRRELQCLEEKWKQLERSLGEHPAFQIPNKLRVLEKASRYLRWGITIRDAWMRVYEEHNIVSCLSADDSNPYTRIPLLLAQRRNIPAVAVHHGALDCFMAFKELRFSDYIAKGEMERDYLEAYLPGPRRSHSRRRGVDARSKYSRLE